jgi:glyceraldehyde-3-phosphate dehydrogenase/erythrose-4-phosphate dehydrogenase
MKYAIIAMFLSLSALASDPVCSEQVGSVETTGQLEIKTDVPSHLKGATITVHLANGKETTVPAEQFKVVPRKQQFITTATEVTKVSSCTTNTPNKNRLSLVGGHGTKSGLETTVTGTTTEVETRAGLIGGAQYQRMLNDTISVGVQGQTNKTGSVLIGVDF